MKAVAVLLALAGVAHAEERRAVTLAEAYAAVDKAPQSVPLAAQIVVADANVDAAGAWPDPALHVAATRLTAVVVGGVTLPVPVFGTVGAARAKAKAEAAVVRAEVAVERTAQHHAVTKAWIELARADGVVVASSLAAQQAAELELIARGRKDAGVGADVDITIAHAAKARAELEVAAAERLHDAASAELAGLLGWDPAVPLRAEGPLVTGTGMSLDAIHGRLLGHPEHLLAQERASAAVAATREVAVGRWPRLALEGEVLYDDRSMTEGRTAWDRTDASVGVSIELPIFAHVGDRVRAARAQETVERARLAATDVQLKAGVHAAYRRWQAASDRVIALERDVLPAQQRAAALSAQAFREGARDLASALQAQRDLAAVQAEVNAARADAATAFSELQLAAGIEVTGAP